MDEPVRKTIQLDLEIDTESKVNKFQWMIDLAQALDAWRPFPRLFIGIYIYLLYESVIWFIELDKPTMEQAGLVSIMTGVGAAWFKMYVDSKNSTE